MHMRAVVVETDGLVRDIGLDGGAGDLAALQAAVGGDIESLALRDDEGGVVAYGNEWGAVIGLDPNPVASRLLRLRPGDVACGPVVFTAVDKDGGTAQLPDDFEVG